MKTSQTALIALIPAPWRPGVRWGWHHLTLRGSRRIVEWRMHVRAQEQTFNGRLAYKMTHDRRRLLPKLADKVAVKDYITSTIGPRHVAATWAVEGSVQALDWSRLPGESVVKVNHGSGGLVMITADAPTDARLPEIGSRTGWARFRVRPEHADRDRIADMCEH